ncbi:MAG: hypothetical protein KDA20_06120 [Phycisphaerales bacterium]|nr:hypothetical protein [Phycisphaerales bacterium]
MNDGARLRAWGIAALLVALCVVMRIVPHTWNVTPVAATALFAGFMIRNRAVAMLVPMAALLIGDLFGPGLYDAWLMVAVYAGLAAPALLGRFVRGKWMPLRVLGASVLGSVLFFGVTNLAAFFTMGLYARSFGGLVECYVAGLPFFRNTLLGDLAWNCTLFGAWAVLPMAWARLRTSAKVAA